MVPRVPKYRKHPNGQAFVEHRSIPTKSHRLYLGKFGSPESKAAYERVVRQILAGSYSPPVPDVSGPLATISDLLLQYLDYVERRYSRNGKPTRRLFDIRDNLRPLWLLFGDTPAIEFGPRALRSLQQALVDARQVIVEGDPPQVTLRRRYARSHINQLIQRTKGFFRWCCADERLPPEHYHKLLCVEGIQPGQTSAREPERVRAVPRAWVNATLPFLSRTVRAMVEIQLACGMRPNEVCSMRTCDINTSGPVWLYMPERHKTAHHGYTLVKAIPKATQAILRPFLSTNLTEYIFSPRKAETERLGHCPDRGTRAVRDHYDTDSYRRAINYGLAKAARKGVEIPHWHPNQLRHLIATEISQKFGQQVAQRWLGHADLETTSIYTEADVAELITIATKLDRLATG